MSQATARFLNGEGAVPEQIVGNSHAKARFSYKLKGTLQRERDPQMHCEEVPGGAVVVAARGPGA
eukprot:1857894-Pyramimonas_sp.AAC.1